MTIADEEYVNENKEYILGLYELYHDDVEIEKILATKGLSQNQINLLLQITKLEKLQKRLQQAKKIFKSGLIISSILWLIYYLFKLLPEGDTLLDGNGSGEFILKAEFILYREMYYFFLITFSLQTLFGAYLIKKRKKELVDFNFMNDL